jgi:1,4-dihydroxy-2-naphthoate octaprenyltransferase
MHAPPTTAPPAFLHAWWLAIRPKTLTATIAPVMVGSALAVSGGAFEPLPALAALAGGLLIQIGTNLANDVQDYRRGADTAARLGPTRVVQAGLLTPRAVAGGAAAAFGAATLIGLYLVAIGGWPILALGLASIIAGVLYTAGPRPLAYIGLGDPFVMAFFGVGAVAGTYYVQALAPSPAAILLGVAVGAMSVGILAVNNLRDIDTDRAAGKRTLAVRMGEARTRAYYAGLIALAFVVPVLQVLAGGLSLVPGAGGRVGSGIGLGAGALLVLVAAPVAWIPVRHVRSGASGAALNPVLGLTARAQLWHAACLAAGLIADPIVKSLLLAVVALAQRVQPLAGGG